MLTHKELKAKALKRPDVKAEYDRLEGEFSFLDEFLKARAESGITQAEAAKRIGTTQSAIARLESGQGKHSPSLATLQRYAQALGCRLDIRLVKEATPAFSACKASSIKAAGTGKKGQKKQSATEQVHKKAVK